MLRPAFYLACSWTWVIGMYFPVFLIHDFGWPGWVAFAIPNVIGAAAMGAVLRRPGASDRLVDEHSRAMWWFSAITVAFHVSVLSWLLTLIASSFLGAQMTFIGPVAASVLTAVAIMLARTPYRRMRNAAPVIWIISLLAVWLAWRTTNGAALAWPPMDGAYPLRDLGFATPALVLGFALCPYLDLTFHRVRRETPGNAGVHAFMLGFGVFFLAMITLSLFYAGPILNKLFSLWLLVHIGLQSVYTMALHLGEMTRTGHRASDSRHQSEPGTRTTNPQRVLSPVLIALIFVALCTAILPLIDTRWTRTSYEVFMSFYAIVFPAYAWIVMIPRGLAKRSRLITFGASVITAMPFMWFGWTQQHWVLVPIAVAIVLLAPYIARATTQQRPDVLTS